MSKDACGPEGQVCRLHARGGAGLLLLPDALGPRRRALVHVDRWNAPCTEVNPPSESKSCLSLIHIKLNSCLVQSRILNTETHTVKFTNVPVHVKCMWFI